MDPEATKYAWQLRIILILPKPILLLHIRCRSSPGTAGPSDVYLATGNLVVSAQGSPRDSEWETQYL